MKKFSKKYNIIAGTSNQVRKRQEIVDEIRNKRVKPGLDDKILTSWNAMMLRGYIDAYRAFGEERFLNSAIKNADFLSNNAISRNNEITRNYKNGKSSIPGLLDDYSFTISAFIDLYQATFDEKWLYKANELTDYTILHFFDTSSGMFYYTPDNHSDLIARKMEITDNVIPSSNSEMAMNLFCSEIISIMNPSFKKPADADKRTEEFTSEYLLIFQLGTVGNSFYKTNI